MFSSKTLLITGGTGSFGNAVLNRFLDTDIAEIRIFSRDEKKQDDMRKKYNNQKLKFYIGDVRDYRSMRLAVLILYIMQRHLSKFHHVNFILWKPLKLISLVRKMFLKQL